MVGYKGYVGRANSASTRSRANAAKAVSSCSAVWISNGTTAMPALTAADSVSRHYGTCNGLVTLISTPMRDRRGNSSRMISAASTPVGLQNW